MAWIIIFYKIKLSFDALYTMPKESKNKRAGNIYDRIFRENAEYIFLPLIEQLFGFTILSYKKLQVKFPQTTEREVDFLYEIIQSDSKKFILHIEFQSNNDPLMLERMQEYHSKIYRKYKLPIKSLVVNVGKQKFTARNKLNTDEIFTGYDVINLFELSKDDLLSAQVPEVVLLALLASYPESQIESVLRLIIKKLKQIVVADHDLKRYINQLLILSRLRNFEHVTEELINDMPIFYDVEKDSLYQKGMKKGIALGEEKGIEKGIALGEEKVIEKSVILLHKAGYSATEISEAYDYNLEKVIHIIDFYKLKNK